MSETTGCMISSDKKSASPMVIWLDGVVCVPSAWRRKCSTTMMRRNGVTDMIVAASSDHVRYAVPSHHRGAALPAPGTQNADNAVQPDHHRTGALFVAADHATRGLRHLPQGLGADGKRAIECATGIRRGLEAAQNVSLAICPRARHPDLS